MQFLTPITYYLSPVIHHLSSITYHLLPITCHRITYPLAPSRIRLIEQLDRMHDARANTGAA